VSVLELVRLDPDSAAGAIERIHGASVYRLRGRLLPLVELAQLLGLSSTGGAGRGAAAVHILVMQADEQVFGLVVDEIHDTQEIVVKPLGRMLQGISVFAGATILGDGRVALILDVPGLARQGGVAAGQPRRAAGHGPQVETVARRQALLLFQAGEDRRMAIPLSRVARLEEFAGASVEHAGGHPVVQYRGGLLPLIRVAEGVTVAETGPAGGSLRVVVYSHQGHDVGLVVEDILDVVEDAPAEYARVGHAGATTAVIQDRVTVLLDPHELVEDSGVPLYTAARPVLAGMGP
jgi:two-component system chemotaxis sensor kinase CheA